MEPVAVGVGEVVVPADPAFEGGDGGQPHSQVTGGRGERDVLGLSQRPQIGDAGDAHRTGQAAEHLPGDGPLQEPDDLLLRPARGGLPRHLLAGSGVAGHTEQGDAVEGRVGCPVAAA